MSKQTFVANTILTAAQLNTLQANDYNQTVSTKTASYTLVASDAGTRVVMNVASGNTVTVNTSLFSAGDTLIIQNIGAGVTIVTAGTATVSSAGPLTISQYGSGTLYFTSAGVSLWFPSAGPTASSGLTFISSGSFGTGTTFSLPNNSFTSTYTNYLLTYTNVQLSGSNLMMRMRVSGTDVTSSDYSCGLVQSDMAGTVSGVGISSGDNFRIASSSGSQVQSANGFMNIFNPNTSVVTFITFANMGNNSTTNNGAGRLNLSSAQDSLTFFGHNSVPFTGGNYILYGLGIS